MRNLFFAIAAVFALPLASARADAPVYSENLGVAMRGYDVVAYFTVGAPRQGKGAHAVMWKGATWLFMSDDNRQAFEANPRAFAPKFGGYCAFAVANGYLMEGSPENWEIVDGQLFVTYSPAVHTMWARDIPGNIASAQRQWPAVLHN
ncbi:MAG: YHS domain-containing (seleno)protein [Paracoccaceae bacterium]